MTEHLIANRYELGDPIGSGAMGDVYRAVDLRSGEAVAVKHLKPELVRHEASMLDRFIREGETLRELNHPNIVALLEAVEEQDAHYLIMEYIPGGDLHDVLDKAPEGLPLDQTLHIAIELADALTRAHYRHIVHRDIKPANILIADDGSPRLTDFGFAHYLDAESLRPTSGVVGTLYYLSPEACLGDALDERADIWAFGVVLFEMVTGQRPFTGSSPAAVISAILNEPVPDLHALRPDISDDLADLILRMLTKSSEARIPSVRLVGVAIEQMLKSSDKDRPAAAGAVTAQAAPRPRRDSMFDTPMPDTATPQRSNLPAQSTPFVGRQHQLAQVEQLLTEGDCRLLTLLGPGGMGKTRLGIEAASRLLDQYEQGTYFVGLAPVSATENIVPTIADAVGYRFHGTGTPEDQLRGYLANKSMLLVIDNFEHLIEGAGILKSLLDSAPAVHMLATSRARLNVGAECVYEVGGMDVPENDEQVVFEEIEAVEMFITYARRARPGFELTPQDRPAVTRICQLVGGMPLGLELAASWARVLAPEDIAAELESDIDFLASERGDLPDRLRSMRAAFDYSWNLLDEDEQQALMRFSVFRGGSSRRAAQEVTGASLRTLTGLVDQSLTQRDGETGNFYIHELVRQFAAERLAGSGDEEAIRSAHARYYLTALAERLPDLKGWKLPEAIKDISEDIDNIRAAWSWALDSGMMPELDGAVDSIFLFCYLTSRMTDIDSFFEEGRQKLAPAGTAQPHPVYGKVLSRRWGHLQASPVDARIEGDLAAANEIATANDDAFEIAFTLLLKGYAAYQVLGDPEESVSLFKDTLARFREIGDPYYIVWALHRVGYAQLLVNRGDEFLSYSQESLDLALQIGDRLAAANCLFNLGSADLNLGEYETARERFELAIELAAEIDTKLWQMAHAEALLAIVLIMLGESERARPVAESTLALDIEIAWGSVYSYVPFILLSCVDEDHDHAQVLSQITDDLYINPFGEQLLIWATTLAQTEQGPFDYDRASFRPVIQGVVEMVANTSVDGHAGGLLQLSAPVAFILARDGRSERAVELLALCLTHPRAPVAFYETLPSIQRLRHSPEERLGAEAYQAAWERGKTLRPAALLDLLREEGFYLPEE